MKPENHKVTGNNEILKSAEAKLSPPQLADFKRIRMQQYRKSNILLASALFIGVASVCN
jgi:hypothetical protein